MGFASGQYSRYSGANPSGVSSFVELEPVAEQPPSARLSPHGTIDPRDGESRGTWCVGLLLGAICFIAFYLRLGANGLFDLDEALSANAAREMVLHRDYVSPTVNGAFFFEKPPFIYWCAAVFFHIVGINELGARLPAAIASTLLAFLIFKFGSRIFGMRAGFLAGAFFGLSPIVLGAGRQLTTDAMLALWISCALISYFKAASSTEPT